MQRNDDPRKKTAKARSVDAEGLIVQSLRSALAGPFDFTVPTGTCLAITGASGSGKSLLLRLVADLDPGSGTVRLGDLDRQSVSGPEWRRQCRYVAATPGFWRATAAEHFEPKDRAIMLEMARLMLLDPDRLAAPVDQLSTGERQRVALLRACIADPPLLLLDEPTGPLDATATQAVASVLAGLMEKGTTLILVTHDDSLAKQLASVRREMRDRRLVAA